MKITPLKVLRIDVDKTLRLSVAFPVYRIVLVRGSRVSVGVGRRESSNDENETNKVAPVPTSPEIRNIMKSKRSYLNAHSNGEMNNKMNDIERVDHLMIKW
ncbi:hypothetical protein TNCV_4324181 [Trichonephila clavipes]|nr:hypothetical protein TNCV_4324181 [Trichonephila clavipes]